MKSNLEKSRFPLVWKPINIRNACNFFGGLGGIGLVTSIITHFADFHAKQDDGSRFFFSLFGAVFLTACFGWFYALRTRVEANEIGLRWRGVRGPWKSARWEEITDFWLSAPGGLSRTVETPLGLVDFDKASAGQEISNSVAQQAVNAKIRDWEIKGERLCDEWPRRFEFRYSVSWWGLGTLLCFCLGIVFWGGLFLFSKRAELEVIPFAAWVLAYVGPLAAALTIPVLLLGFVVVLVAQAFPFKNQSLEISPSGLLWKGSEQTVTANWADVENWSWGQRGRRLFLLARTKNGVIEIPQSIPQFEVLCRIIERFGGVELSSALEDFLMSRRLPQVDKNGELIFRVGQFELSLLRWLLVMFIVLMPALPWLMKMADPTGPKLNPPSGWGVAAFLLGLLILLEWWVRSHWIRVTEQVLERHGPNWNCSVPWAEIEKFGRSSNGSWIEIQGEKLHLSRGFMMENASRLRAEIERRAINAQGSWEKETSQNRTQ